ncbi:hypothetical protein AO902_30500 [Pseudomonas aeruginosa]|uniref:SDR family oxidoreductase n=1 Tax=Pseudomonas aeruginosa TaxID=287 RepID=UPI0009AC48EB|nr:hypothetical protein AO902_30500 [Pseudomonas aeruginosa]
MALHPAGHAVSTRGGSSLYAAGTAGLSSLSAELPERGIQVSALAPGPPRTPALDKVAPELEPAQALRERIVDLVPPGRPGEPLEIANAAGFLASDEPSCMYGTEILVDGGVRHLKKRAKARSWRPGRKLNRRRAPARPPARPGSRIARRYPRHRR